MNRLLIRRSLIVVLLFVVLLGASMAFDARFVPLSWVSSNPLFVIIIYSPTIICAFIVVRQLFRHRIWPAAAFSIGLVCTGFFHQWIAGQSYGNPGYMVPIGHIFAPALSMVAYLASFLVFWVIVRFSKFKISYIHEGDYEELHRSRKDNGPT